VQYQLAFPSAWYREENAMDEHQRYLPEIVSVGESVSTDIAEGKRSVDVDALIECCAVLGLPDGYFPAGFSRDAEGTDRTRSAVTGNLYIAEMGVSDLLAATIPPGAFVIVIDDGASEGEVPAGRRGVPFLERDGRYWGKPADDDTAIRELERLRQSGADFLAFTSPAVWWLHYYQRFSSYLYGSFRCIVQGDSLVVFDLRDRYTRAAPPGVAAGREVPPSIPSRG
jgi:hypothetical protein